MYSSTNTASTGGLPAIAQEPGRIPLWKRTLDVACCLVVLPLLAVCTLLMALVMKLLSPGPVFFRQERVGYMGRRFKIYKFRTMKVDADTAGHQAYFKELVGTNAPMQKLDSQGDKRLIPFGWLLRASGLDELPQLINVLIGDMSIVGPRPCLPAEYDLYLPWQRERFSTMPGLTGLWQVSGKNRTTFDEMIRLDIRYAKAKTLGLDLQIMFRTPIALLRQLSDTRTGRLSKEQLMQTRPPMPISQVARFPETAGNR
ncbi:MAG TPA: sugar transferase [Candidatus Didemnitutus sp.]|nr:sugar transferase [Candidatus Didemnitutus sp.]